MDHRNTAAPVRYARDALWVRAGVGLRGSGGTRVALTGPRRLARLAEIWRRLEAASSDPDVSPVAFVSSTFVEDSAVSSVLHVPASVRRVSEEGEWTQFVSSAALADALAADAEGLGEHAAHAARELPDGDLGLTRDEDDEETGDTLPPPSAGKGRGAKRYTRLVKRVLTRIAAGEAEKVVTSRAVDLTLTPDVLGALPATLAEAYPNAWTFAVGGLVGATPEMLAARDGDRVTSRVLAGSLPRGTRPDDELRAELTSSERFAAEHAHAARSVIDGLARVLTLENSEPEPFVLELPNILHLATDVVGTPTGQVGLLDVVDGIHPTAAVGGTPTDAALAIIADLETHDRGRYAGPVGWLDAAGDGEIGLALRCGQVDGHSIRLYAGGGIVAGADPAAELAETEGKLRPMREALGDVTATSEGDTNPAPEGDPAATSDDDATPAPEGDE
jgi:menaquinone-specific isochorismate synthase